LVISPLVLELPNVCLVLLVALPMMLALLVSHVQQDLAPYKEVRVLLVYLEVRLDLEVFANLVQEVMVTPLLSLVSALLVLLVTVQSMVVLALLAPLVKIPSLEVLAEIALLVGVLAWKEKSVCLVLLGHPLSLEVLALSVPEELFHFQVELAPTVLLASVVNKEMLLAILVGLVKPRLLEVNVWLDAEMDLHFPMLSSLVSFAHKVHSLVLEMFNVLDVDSATIHRKSLQVVSLTTNWEVSFD